MKITSKFIAALAISAAFTSASLAGVSVPRDSETIDYGINSADFSKFHFGLHVEGGKHAMEYKGTDIEVDANRYVGFLGYDISRSTTFFITVGSAKSECDNFFNSNEDENSTFTFGAGIMLNLIDINQFDFLTTVSRYRIQASSEIFYADFDDYSWTEFDAAITFQIFNEDANNNTNIFPTRFALFVGPCVSVVISDELDQSSNDIFGIKGGVSILFTDNVYATAGAEFYGDNAICYGTVGVNF